MMKRFFFLLSILFGGLALHASEANALMLHLKSGQNVLYLFDEEPVIRFAGGEILVQTKEDKFSYKVGSVTKLTAGYIDQEIDSVMQGDTDGDHEVTLRDVTLLIEQLNGRTTFTIKRHNADSNRNGVLDKEDVLRTLRIINKKRK